MSGADKLARLHEHMMAGQPVHNPPLDPVTVAEEEDDDTGFVAMDGDNESLESGEEEGEEEERSMNRPPVEYLLTELLRTETNNSEDHSESDDSEDNSILLLNDGNEQEEEQEQELLEVNSGNTHPPTHSKDACLDGMPDVCSVPMDHLAQCLFVYEGSVGTRCTTHLPITPVAPSE